MSIFSVASGVFNHPLTTFLAHLTAMVRRGGLFLPSSAFEASEPDGGGLNVDVDPGVGFVKGAGNAYPVISDSTVVVPINPNASGSPRITSIILAVDVNATPGYEGQGADVADLYTVDGTPAGSPVPPDDAAIQAALGSGVPWERLWDVDVASGASGISNDDLTDRRRRVFMKSPSPIVTVTFASPWEPDYEDSNQQLIILTNNLTISEPVNMEIGDVLKIQVVQDGSGDRVITWFGGITWLSPDIQENRDANAVSVFAIEKTGDGEYNGYLIGKEF
jgi:hypothetical protein